MNTQQELEQERAELLSKNAVMEQEISDLQRYIDTHLARSVRTGSRRDVIERHWFCVRFDHVVT